MAKHIKKTDQNKAWNRRSSTARAYNMESRAVHDKRFLIICEGENTEPQYFKSFPVLSAKIEAFGMGRSKTSLVEQAIDFVSQGEYDPNQEVWIVFDMDVNPLKELALQRNDFNEAVRLAQSKGYHVAYSNDAFELWFLLHYQLLESALTRVEYYERISQLWGLSYERHGKGIQFCRGVYNRMLEDPTASQEAAIRHAERLHQQQVDLPASNQNPCTTVYQLEKSLNEHLR